MELKNFHIEIIFHGALIFKSKEGGGGAFTL